MPWSFAEPARTSDSTPRIPVAASARSERRRRRSRTTSFVSVRTVPVGTVARGKLPRPSSPRSLLPTCYLPSRSQPALHGAHGFDVPRGVALTTTSPSCRDARPPRRFGTSAPPATRRPAEALGIGADDRWAWQASGELVGLRGP